MTTALWVLDTGAMMAYAHGVDAVGEILVDASDNGALVAVPLLCLIEAYSLLHYDEHEMLRVLRGNEATRIFVPVTADDSDECPQIGSMAARAGRLGAGHAAYLALINAAGVVTSRADQIRAILGPEWVVREV
jgi:hypothetical protein